MAVPITVITEPTRKSRKFEDNVTVIRIFNPDQERMAAALKKILSFPENRSAQKGEEVSEANKMPTMQSQACGV